MGFVPREWLFAVDGGTQVCGRVGGAGGAGARVPRG